MPMSLDTRTAKAESEVSVTKLTTEQLGLFKKPDLFYQARVELHTTRLTVECPLVLPEASPQRCRCLRMYFHKRV